jgi:cell division protein ZapE
VVLVATSNIEPARLYENGLQRQRFLPAIALLEKQTTVVNVDGGVDYRLRTLTQATLYHWPLDDQANVNLAKGFNALAPDMAAPKNGEEAVLDATGADSQERPVKGAAGSVSVNGRKFNYIKKTEGVIWFSFDQLCAMPRSQNDYLELALEFHSLIVSDVPCLKVGMEDQARRFVNLVDVCYDANLKLILSAQVPLLELYNGGSLDFVFQRTLSRLQEMQSVEYLARAHVPA